MPILGPLGYVAGSAILGAGSNLLSNIFGAASTSSTNKNNLKINQMNNAFNERMMQKQMDYNTMMWEKQNEYNSPEGMRARGINPYASMMGGNFGSAQAQGVSAASAASAAPQQAFHPNFQGIPESILMAKQGAKIDAETRQQVIDNQTRAIKNMHDIANTFADTKNKAIQHKLMRIQYNYADELHDLQVQNERARLNTEAEQAKYVEAQRILTSLQGKRYNEIVDMDLAYKLAQVELYADQRNLTAEQYRKEVYNTIVAEFEARTGEVNYRIAKETADDVIDSINWRTNHGKVQDLLNDVKSTLESVGQFGRKPKMQKVRSKFGNRGGKQYYEDIYELR